MKAIYVWGTADEISFIARLALLAGLHKSGEARSRAVRETLARYARALELRSNWSGLDRAEIAAEFERHGVAFMTVGTQPA